MGKIYKIKDESYNLEASHNEIIKSFSEKLTREFGEIKHTDENQIEFWYARELQVVLNYKEWRAFENVINKVKELCENSDINTFEHFVDVNKLSKRANNAGG